MNNLILKLRKNKPSSAVLSVVLAVAILLSTFSGMFILADTSNKLWDGTPASGYQQGSGTKEDPFIVSTPAELFLTVTSTGMDGGNQLYYKMVNDIYVNDVSSATWKSAADNNQWAVVSTSAEAKETAFGGVFNGNGYKVFGLFVDKTYEAPAEGFDTSVATGLFPSVKDSAKISAVGVENSYFALRNNAADANKAYAGYVGVIAGYAYLSTASDPIVIDRTYVSEDCYTAGVYCGMVAGFSSNKNKALKLSNSYGLATGNFHNGVEGNRFILVSGGIWASAAQMEYTFSNGGLSFTGCNSISKANYCCNWVSGNGFATKLPLADMKGEKALEKMSKLNGEGAFRVTESFPVLRIFDRTETGEKIRDGSFTEPTVGTGEETNPIIINTPEELAYVIKNGGKDKFYRLEADIYLNDVNKINWQTGEVEAGYSPNVWINSTAANNFKGTIDGNAHVVYGIYYENLGTSKWEFAGTALIPYVNSGSVAVLKNLGLDKVYINNTKTAGGLFGGNAKGEIVADQCYVGADVTLKGHLAGAFVGGSSGQFTFTNCYSLADVSTHGATSGDSYYGLYGDAYGMTSTSVMQNCYNGKGPMTTKKVGPYTRTNIFAIADPSGNGYATLRTADKMQGLDALTNAAKMQGLGDKFVATTTYPILKCFAKVEYSQHWDGATTYAPIKGEGTKEAPFEIENAYMLAYVIKNGGGKNKYYKLTADIYLNDTDKVDWKTGEIKNDTYVVNEWYTSKDAPVFKGNIDGDGHVIYGLYSKTEGDKEWKNFTAAAGLIPNIGNGTVSITNLGIDCAYLKHPNTAGLFIGMSAAGEALISTSFAGENTHLSSYDAGVFVGSISGALDLKYCYSHTTFDADTHLQGFAGDIYRSPSNYHGERPTASIVGCYIANSPLATKGPSGVSNCYDAYTSDKSGLIKLAPENMQGLDALSNKDKMVKLSTYRVYQATEGYPVLRVFLENPEPLPELDEEKIWNGSAATYFAEGTGSEKDPYIISKGSELALMIESGGNGGAYFKLKNDIYLNDVSETLWYEKEDNKAWYTDNRFNGHLDGDGHCVYGIWYPKNNANTTSGLIPVFAKGSIKNIGVRYSYIFAEKYAGGLAGKTHMGAQKTISTCFVDDTVQIGYTGGGNYGAGGLIGYADSDTTTSQVRILIENCYSKALIEGASSDRTNGLMGTVWKSAVKVVNSYSVNAAPYYMAGHGTISALYWDYSKEEKYTDGAEGLVPINDIINGVYADKGAIRHGNNYTILEESLLRGEAAKNGFAKFDFENVWQIAEKGTPTLKIFGLKGDDVDISADGVTYASGSGKKNDPYIIETVAQLRYMMESTKTEGKYYKLANDLYINDTSKKNWMQNSPALWYSYGAYQGPVFKGTFEGDGHYIYGVYIADTPEAGETIINGAAGLFPNAGATATIKNLHLRDSYISGKAYAGAFVGFTTANVDGRFMTLIGCSADESVTVKGQTAGGLVGGGGILTDLQYVYFTGKVDATSEGRENAFVGDVWKSGQRLAQGYSVGYTNYRSGFYPTYAQAVYATVAQPKATTVAESAMYGAAAKATMSQLDWSVWYTVNGKTPHLKVVTDDKLATWNAEGEKGKVWSGYIATKFAGGSGTEEDPYLIETPEQMAFLINNSAKTEGKYYKLTADLKLNDTSKAGWENNAKEWLTSGNAFVGHFNGDGHVVSGLYFNTANSIVGLFPRVGAGAVIEKVGVVNSVVISVSNGKESYAAALVGYVAGRATTDNVDNYTLPVISQCFGDDTVYVEAMFAGGLVCGNQRALRMDNCYFTGELFGDKFRGALVANSWNGWASYISNTYAVTLDHDPVAMNGVGKFQFENVYADGDVLNTGDVIRCQVNNMKGEKAKETMPALDYQKIWKTVNNGTPVLRCFANAEKYTSHRLPKEIEISFATEGGEKLDAVMGYAGAPIGELPTPVRYGYDFVGWYVNSYKIIPFELETFPDNDMVIYAEWVQNGFTQGFEGVQDSKYDYNEGTEAFRPGAKGYNPKYIHGGMKSMHTLPDSAEPSVFLLNYENPLEIGKEYDVNLWIYVKNDDATGTTQFLHALHPQFDSPVVGYEDAIDLSEVEAGKWVNFRVTIVANAPYLLVKTAQGNEVYYDDFHVVDLRKEGEVGKIDGFNPTGLQGEPDLFGEIVGFVLGFGVIGIIVVAAAGVVLLAGVTVAIILIVKAARKKKNKK